MRVSFLRKVPVSGCKQCGNVARCQAANPLKSCSSLGDKRMQKFFACLDFAILIPLFLLYLLIAWHQFSFFFLPSTDLHFLYNLTVFLGCSSSALGKSFFPCVHTQALLPSSSQSTPTLYLVRASAGLTASALQSPVPLLVYSQPRSLCVLSTSWYFTLISVQASLGFPTFSTTHIYAFFLLSSFFPYSIFYIQSSSSDKPLAFIPLQPLLSLTLTSFSFLLSLPLVCLLLKLLLCFSIHSLLTLYALYSL